MNLTILRLHELPVSQRALIFAAAEQLHRQLRPKLPQEYATYMETMLHEGAGMLVLSDEDLPVAIGVFRMNHTTFAGLRFYVDDLVTDEAKRSRGYGKYLLDALKQEATAKGCHAFTLESGSQRAQAHKFYFREGMTIPGFSFQSSLSAW
ncbi:MAG: GNAT family N-acetyltransferase [Spirochaetia bacterium]|nr:GNAT family N-acetyltransferase [Spirochaetia bacterium]